MPIAIDGAASEVPANHRSAVSVGTLSTLKEQHVSTLPIPASRAVARTALPVSLALVLPFSLALVLPQGARSQEADAASSTVTLERAIQVALDRSPQMLQQEQAIDNASLAQRSAWAAFLPNVNANTSGSLRSSSVLDPNTGRIVGGSSDSYSAGLSANVPLFQGGSRFIELGATEADMRAAVARREDQRHAVILQTKNLFFNALRQEELVDVRRVQLERTEQNLELVSTRLTVGRATVSDSLRARLDVVNARQDLLEAQTALRAARISLGRQIGSSAPAIPETPPGLAPSPLPLTEAEIMVLAEESSPTVVAAMEAADASAAAVSVNKTAYLPNINLSTGYNWNNQERSLTGGSTSWNMGLSVSYPIFNRFQRESNIDRAQMTLRVSRLQEDDARLAARQEADAALNNLRTAELAIGIAEEAVLVAEEDLRVVRERYALGVATILDVVISQAAADQASADLVGARYDYILARAELEAILGREL